MTDEEFLEQKGHGMMRLPDYEGEPQEDRWESIPQQTDVNPEENKKEMEDEEMRHIYLEYRLPSGEGGFLVLCDANCGHIAQVVKGYKMLCERCAAQIITTPGKEEPNAIQ